MFYTKRFFRCLYCGVEEFSIEHMFSNEMNDSFGPWYCHNCGYAHEGKRVNGEWKVSLNKNKVFRYDKTALLQLKDSDIWVLVPHPTMDTRTQESEEEKSASQTYLYEEHQCPESIFRNIEAVIIDSHEDMHGAFELKEIIDGRIENRDSRSFLKDSIYYEDVFGKDDE